MDEGSYLLRTKFLDPKYAPLAGRFSPVDAYADLANSTADVVKFFEGQGDEEVEKLFWSQFNAPTRPLPLNEKVAAMAELHRLSGLVMCWGTLQKTKNFLLVSPRSSRSSSSNE